MKLSDLKEQDCALIKKIILHEADLARLRQLGMIEGKKIRLITTTLFQDPLLYQVEDTLVAIRRNDARKIIVERMKE